MKKPDNRFRRDLRRRPIWRRNAALGAIMADIDAHIGQMLKGVCSFDPVGTFVASLARHVVAPKIAKMIAADLLEATNEATIPCEFTPGEGFADFLRENGYIVGEA